MFKLKKIALVIMLGSSLFAANNTFLNKGKDSFRSEAKPGPYMDFGIQGKLYKIIEPDMYEVIISAAKEWSDNLDKKKLEEIVKSEVDKRATFIDKETLMCKETYSTKWKDDYFTYKMDYYNPMGRLIYKKGDKRLTPSLPEEKHLCVIDATLMVEAINQINFFQKETNGNCVYVVSNRNVMELWDKFPSYEIYPSTAELNNRFDIKCLPVKIDMFGTKIKNNYYSIEMFKN